MRRASAGEGARAGDDPRAPTGRCRLLALCLLVTFVNFAVWSVATPLFASPDEPAQVVHAVAAVRGQVVGRTDGSARNATTRVTIPEVFAAGDGYPTCFVFKPTVPASCARPLPTSTRDVAQTTYVGRYPPLYYLVVGLPSLAAPSAAGVYLMRLMSALVNALLVALALFAVARWSERRILLIGVLAASTPMVWFLGGVVNPSGMEICAALCLWTAGAVLVLERPERPPPGLVAVAAVALGVLVSSRPLSPLWAGVVTALLALAGGRRALAGLSRSRAARVAAAPLAACAAFAVWWVVTRHSLDLERGVPVGRHESGLRLLLLILGRTGTWLKETVGVFGWLDTNAPGLTYLLDAAAVGVLLALALGSVLARRTRDTVRGAGALVLLVAAVLVLPAVIVFSQAHRLGIVWQGRDIMPLAVGVPVLSAALVQRSELLERSPGVPTSLATAVGAGCVAAEVAAFIVALRRYTVGVGGQRDLFSGTWRPPLGAEAVAVWASVAFAALVLAIVYAQSRRAPAERCAGAPGRPQGARRPVRALLARPRHG